MSGNLCRCAAYANIVPAIADGGRYRGEAAGTPGRGGAPMKPFAYERADDRGGGRAALAERARRRRIWPAGPTSWT